MVNKDSSQMYFPVVSNEVCESIKIQLKHNPRYLEQLLDKIQAENPSLGEFIVTSANKLADSLPERFETMSPEEMDTLVNFIRGNAAWMMCAVYNSLREQYVVDELESV